VIVSLASVLLVAMMLTGVLVVVSAHLQATAVNALTADDAALMERLVDEVLREGDLEDGTDAARREAIDAAIAAFTADHGLRAIAIRASGGDVLFGSAPAGPLPADATRSAAAGEAWLRISDDGSRLVEHLPLVGDDGSLMAIVTVERDGTDTAAAAASASRDVLLIFGVGAVVLAGILVLTFRAAQQLINRRTRELVEATRRDRLTGLLNHGAALAELAEMLERAREGGGWVVVALVDVDGFRLLNETHGYAAGDRVLRTVATVLRRHAPEGAVVARGGPDEFVLIGPPPVAPQLRPAIEEVRATLAATPLTFAGAEPITVTVSVGIASYPEHAASVSEVLAIAGVMLADARTGGGNRVRVDAPERGEAPGRWSAFSVLEGLILAVDAKDRYTRLHSEQASGYADLLATALGLSGEDRERIRQAALLHDVGKIGVPDIILRKPAPLTDEERAVMRRHAVLGDAIVGSLPGMETVALAVRHHHERWDGSGYPDRLAGQEIPLEARILSLADVYSALTTARPYRDGLGVEAALERIVAGAGSQFDPALTDRFVAVVRALPDGTMPFGDENPERSTERVLRGAA
jgi:diguanylate cyclase (GGDEF)-like protein